MVSFIENLCVYVPENGVVERRKRAILNTTRAMLNQKFVSDDYLADAVATTTYVCNRVTCGGTPKNQTPFELRTARKPDLGLLRDFDPPARITRAENSLKSSEIKETLLL